MVSIITLGCCEHHYFPKGKVEDREDLGFIVWNILINKRSGYIYPIIKKKKIMASIFVVGFLFILAIVSPFIFPNKMVSDNEHDLKH